MAKLTGAQILVEALKREGVDVVFGIPGGANLPTFDALYKSDIKVVLTSGCTPGLHTFGNGHSHYGQATRQNDAGGVDQF